MENLQELSIELPTLPVHSDSQHALHLFSCGLPQKIDRDEFVWRAAEEFNITLGVHYKSIPSFTAYKYLFHSNHSDPTIPYKHAWDWGNRTISLSLSAAVSDDDQTRILECIKYLLNSYS